MAPDQQVQPGELNGNSVCPDEAETLVAANAADITGLYPRLAA
ncbi:hypothetical protein PSH97_16680 [Pseudomonas cucumis]|uniref:Uncharacterized protein n=1 Tax=Pseudomonas cucumis TaxID=2954082 RepID=A0ABY9F4H7_9PSED|nr:hypothetical protein [Pseudomonas cucumis]WLG87811.1 hypothetical protein PSH97_16680 [Pseudomonas cucumis]